MLRYLLKHLTYLKFTAHDACFPACGLNYPTYRISSNLLKCKRSSGKTCIVCRRLKWPLINNGQTNQKQSKILKQKILESVKRTVYYVNLI